MLDGLPVLPRRAAPYRGQVLEEFDADAALARRPDLLLVDEFAHTNAPGSRRAKRWEDVADLVEAGLHVWATLNVQHLESLNDDVAQVTGVRVTETLPDRALEMADEIEVVDLPPEELRRRLRDGRIYRPDVAGRALDGFFREGNLAALREIALRRAAAHVDDDVRDWMRRSGIAGPFPVGERVLALVGPDKAGSVVVRHAKRLADALHAPWAALHVERPDQHAAEASGMRAALSLAAQLGADTEVRAGRDLVAAVLEEAGRRGATHLVMGRAPAPLWRRITGRILSAQLLRRGPAFALHVVPLPSEACKASQGGATAPAVPAALGRAPQAWLGPAASVLAVAVVTAAVLGLGGAVPREAMGMVYLAVVVAAAARSGLHAALAAAAAAFLAWDFFFLPPLYSVTIGSAQDLIGLGVFAVVAIMVGGLAGRVRAEARAGQARIEGLRRVTLFSRRLGEPAAEPELLAEIARQAAAVAGGPAAVLSGGSVGPEDDMGELRVQAAEPAGGDALLDEGAWAAARRAWAHGQPTGRGTPTLPGAAWRFLPLATARGRLAVLGVRTPGETTDPQAQALAALADQAALALERVRLAGQSARAAAMEETQRLRTALLASLGHDLRTPLTGIQGAAGTLRGAWDSLLPETREDLLSSIEQDVGRMARFLANITDLTRLESGQVSPRLLPIPLAEVVDAAMARLPGAPPVAVKLDDPSPAVLADPALLEQVLVNLLENAVKYSPDGSLVLVRGGVERGAEREAREAFVSVADEGVGIPSGDLRQVFDSFFRVRRGDRAPPGHRAGPGDRARHDGGDGRPHRRGLPPAGPSGRRHARHGRHRQAPARPCRTAGMSPGGARILVVDDEPQVHRFLKPALEAVGYAVERADTAAEGLRLLAVRAPDAVLLDLGLPDLDGQEALARMRAFSRAPVIVISARDREEDKIRALDAGADDYVEKPFAVGELLARLRACLRRVLAEEAPRSRGGGDGVEVDLLRRRVTTDGEEVVLSPREYDLLALLVRNAGRVMTHRQLLIAVWGPAHAQDVQYLRVYVGHLRQKLGTAGSALLRTEQGVGYRLLDRAS